MAAIAHGWKPKGKRAKHMPSQKVAKEFNRADAGTGIIAAKRKHARKR